MGVQQILSKAFPVAEDATGVLPADCWIVKARKVESHGRDVLRPLSEAVDVVARHNQAEMLERRLALVHPIDRSHRRDFDDGLLDCLSEACAFAWADARGMGPPEFRFNEEGKPDIFIKPDIWVEAKALYASDNDRKLWAQAMEEAQRREGPPGIAFRGGSVKLDKVESMISGLIGKFESDYQNAKQKFERVAANGRMIFYNLTVLDLEAMLLKEGALRAVREWAKSKEKEGSIAVVVCVGYDWRVPQYDSYTPRGL